MNDHVWLKSVKWNVFWIASLPSTYSIYIGPGLMWKLIWCVMINVNALTCCQGNGPWHSFFKEFSFCTAVNEAKHLFPPNALSGSLICLTLLIAFIILSYDTLLSTILGLTSLHFTSSFFTSFTLHFTFYLFSFFPFSFLFIIVLSNLRGSIIGPRQ